ncbi:MAG: hypothetical protein ACJ798_05525 [Phenylobacterium sp.]
MPRPATLICTLALAAASLGGPGLANATPADGVDLGAPLAPVPPTRFRCQDGGEILARFVTERGRFVAVVDALDGYGPHTLASRPFEGGPVLLTWSDGHRTLTWSPGVQIMWMDDGAHRMCGRSGHSH